MENQEQVNGLYTMRKIDNKNYLAVAGIPTNIRSRFSKRQNDMATGSVFSNINPNASVTNGMGWQDRDWFRSDEVIPTQPTDIISACMQAYDRFPIVRNIIDMMADFTVKGIDIVNQSPKAEKFAKDWFSRINGKDRAERIAHMLYLAGTVVIERKLGIIPEENTRENPKFRGRFVNPLPKGRIPMGYTILNPQNIVVPTDLENEYDITMYGISNYNKTMQMGQTMTTMPTSWLNKKRPEGASISLNDKKHVMLFYKRKDFEVLPKPLTYPLLYPLRALDKLRLADMAALDGAVSRKCVWTIGHINEKNMEDSIFPTEECLARFSEMLQQNSNGGAVDIVWGPELDFKETGTDIHNFLGKEKYIPTLEEINQGYGVPSSLTGGQSSSGYTNNFVSLRTLSERLEYGRSIIEAFFQFELDIIREVMGFRYPFKLVFDQPSLTDEAAEKRLLIELLDRDVISQELIIERFGAEPEIEMARIRSEQKLRKSKVIPAKASPFHLDSQQEPYLERLFVTEGDLTPEQVGLKYNDPKDREINNLEKSRKRLKADSPSAKPVKDPESYRGQEGKGRPRGAKDKIKRKQKRVVPFGKGSSFTKFMVDVDDAKNKIETLVKAAYLESKNKTNMRQLTDVEVDELENIIFSTLFSFDEYDNLSEDKIIEALNNLSEIPEKIKSEIQIEIDKYTDASIDIIRKIKTTTIAMFKFGVKYNYSEEE